MSEQATILVVDDEPSICFTLSEILTRDGYQVTTVESGKEALALSAKCEFDLALVDLKLRDMDGTEVVKQLRQTWPDMSIIMLTAHASINSAVEALRHGAHDYLFKPCKTLELRESIRRGLLNRQKNLRQREVLQKLEYYLSHSLEDIRASISDVSTNEQAKDLIAQSKLASSDKKHEERFLQYNGLIVDFMRHLITLDGVLLELSPTEFSLLAYMISEAPRVISPKELVREVQGYNSEEWEAGELVRYHIHRIRHKINKATSRSNVIQTVRGVGYTIGE